LRRPIADAVWDHLVHGRWPDDVLEDRAEPEAAMERLVDEARRLTELQKSPPPPRPSRTELPADARGVALSKILAHEAEQLETVKEFRRQFLRGKTIKPASVPSWIRRRAQSEGDPTVWVRHPRGRKGPVQASTETLSYPTGDDVAETVPIRLGGVLWRLRELADDLAKQFPWRPVQAVLFVLAGAVPLVSKARRTVEESGYYPVVVLSEEPVEIEDGATPDKAGDYAATRRVWLELGPFLKPSEVAELYQKARAEIFGTGRDRVLTEKHARMGVFATRLNDGQHTWDAVMSEWNEQHPKESYRDARIFCRDARAAFERITGAPMKWKGARR